MSFMVYFEFWLSWFWFGRKFQAKRAKSGYFCALLDTPSPKRRSARLSEGLCLGKCEAKISDCLIRLGVAVLRLSEPLHLGVALLRLSVPTNPVFVFLFRLF